MSDEAMSNFTPRAQQVLALARKEADRFNHNFVGTEHLLLGLIKVKNTTAARCLLDNGLDYPKAVQELVKVVSEYCLPGSARIDQDNQSADEAKGSDLSQ